MAEKLRSHGSHNEVVSWKFVTLFMNALRGSKERKGKTMATIITASMAYFPYVMVGLGQAIIVGTNPAGRTVHDTAETTGRRIPLMTFEERVKTSGKEDTRPGCPVFTAR
jgi:hypothetical protein